MKLEHLFAPYSPSDTNLVSRLRYWVEHQPSAVSFYYLTNGEDDEVHLTYEDLDRRAQAIASKLTSLGMRGERALLLYPPGLDFVEAFFGCLYAGAVPVPAYPPRRNRNMIRIEAISDDAQAKVALTVAEVIDRVRGTLDESPGLNQLTWLATDQVPDDLATEWRFPEINESTVALLQYTSGSTGTPKGVVLTHANMMHNCGLISGGFEVSRAGGALTWLPTYHDMGLLGGVLSPVFIGVSNVLMSPMAFLQKPVRWLRAITRHQITVSGGPNFAYQLCTEKITPEECEGLDLHTWDVAFNGAEPIRLDTLEAFTKKFGPFGFRAETHYPCYGMAETTLIVTGGIKKNRPVVRAFDAKALEAHKIVPSRNGQKGVRRLVGCGRTLGDVEVSIVEPETCEFAPPDRVGEIWVRSPSVGKGYWNRPEETAKTFQARLNGSGNGAWLRTGDLGFLRDGELFVTGRLKDLIIVRGVNRYPQDIEATVERASERLRTTGAATFALDVDGRERLIVLCEVERTRNTLWDDTIEAIRRDVTRDHELPPDAIVLVRAGSIPKTSSGKVQRHACREDFLNDKLLVVAQWIGWAVDKSRDGETLAPIAERDGVSGETVNQQIARVVMDHVRAVAEDRAKDLGLDSNIVVDVGLDSIERLYVANSLEEAFGGRFPDDVLQQIETCREVAVAIEKHIGTELVKQPEARKTESAEPAVLAETPIPAAYFEFEKFPEYVRLRQTKGMLDATGDRDPFFNVHHAATSSTTVIDGHELLNFASCDYLGMASDPLVGEAAKQAIDRYGTGVSASRLRSGERPVHGELEREIAGFLGTDDAIVFVSGHATNETTIGHLFGPGDLILYDSLAHNSIVKGAELSGARRRPFEHNSPQAVDEVLKELRHQHRRVLIAIDGLYSMDGDYPNVPEFIEVKKRHKAMMLIDEAHSLGTLGMCGRGVSEQFKINPNDVDLWMGTLSKSLGSCGGYLAGGTAIMEYLRYTAPGFVFATGISPANAAAALAALRLLRDEPERVAMLQSNARLFWNLAKQRGLNTGPVHNTPIIPVIIGNSLQALRLTARLFERGVNVQPVIHPAIQEDKTRLRFFVSASHSEQQIRQAVDSVAEEITQLNPEHAETAENNSNGGIRRSVSDLSQIPG